MKSSFRIVVSLGLIGTAASHYVINRFIVNNTVSNDFEYVRPYISNVTGDEIWYGILNPNRDPTNLDFRCGPNGTITGNLTKTATVRAGDTVGFRLGEPHFKYLNYPYDVPRIYHPGPGSVWLSKSPSDNLNTYSGDGDWFKILEIIGRTEQSMPVLSDSTYAPLYQWGLYVARDWNFTIPATTPPGKYLLRFEQVYPVKSYHPNDNYLGPEYFVNCAQIDIVNDEQIGSPGPVAKIPGVYERWQPEFQSEPWDKNSTSTFKYPGPPVWQG
ncbi:glycoside hydrolase [Lophiotrema nucula]|uniref:lytic cellulose monooxygenase (C4-dehydrogenating) n=1 Tax=Lophiotrema nucula TaxID=690887 RepID=A0A6A5ZEQ4_9PLEO|nr:glycoside hydrolase [Lophiotrema nucula]